MTIDETTSSALDTDLADLRTALAGLPFPSRQDDVLATLVRRQVPSRLLWRAGCLSRTRTYHSLDHLCDEISRPTPPGAPPPPGW